ncbi:hypothetical protein PpBr36_04227 [Pyricularia pennisetigena]|uniref:hypothetical protein n=1 Tax=Pyricularia pennisetigena TaxID=1578925 RepID=UPI00115292EA|nr:hypothetical protein PpBr36_04227 [Pyricularia pennisetigena]TLS26598.1 hypothetical protein PpBr36_04227 [Pyricularia pennisetigena]
MASRFFARALTAISAVVGLGECYAPTDYITWGGDNSRNGYRSNHNLDPAIVASPQFQQLFATALPGNYGGVKEQFYSMPLVFTPGNDPEGQQFLYVSTTQNNVYKIDAVTGQIVASRNLAIPFLTLDLKGTQETCADIDPHVGIIGTGVIDPVTETLYVIVKTYADQSKINEPQGRPAGRHNIHALSLADLSERPNFPVNFENLPARNNAPRLFQGGIHNQRPGLLQQGQNIYAGFGSHCVNYNITGWVIGFDKTSGKIVENFATQGEGVRAKGASIWMSGGGIAADDKGSIFYSTGNGYESQLSTIPVEGRNPPTALEEAVVHMTIQEDGKVKPVDFFMPEEKQILDGNDQDLGTSPFVLLPSEFSCGSVKRIGVVTGKTGWTYWLNMDDLGGYRTNGVDKTEGNRDRVLYKFKHDNSVYSGAGVYPHEGGYVYINPIGFPTTVFKFSCVNNAPTFTKVGESVEANTGRLGPSHGAVTSLNGQPGTGLLWTTDVDNPGPSKFHFKIHEAIPGADGKMKLIKGFQITGIRKFTRPIFGNGRVYIPAGAGMIYGFGAPTKPALNCTGSSNFGATEIGMEAAEQVITCTAKIPVTITNMTVASPDFTITDQLPIPRTLAVDASFRFKAHFKPTSVGNLTSAVRITTQNTDATNSYSITSSVALSGQGQSSGALISLQPKSLVFSPMGVGAEPTSLSLTIANQGKAALTVGSVGYSTSPTGPWDATQSGQFTFSDVPSTIAPETTHLAKVTFSPSQLGNFTLYVNLTTNGGSELVKITASTGTRPKAVIQFEKPDGSGWVTWAPNSTLNFGNVTQNTERRLRLRLSNGGGADAVALEVPISKPPFGTGGLIGAANQADLAEGTRIQGGQFAEAVVVCHAPKTNWNVDAKTERAAWTFNFNDPTMGKVNVPFDCTAVSQQGGPLKADGDGLYRYVACFRDNTPNRQLAQQVLASDKMTTDLCLKACADKGYTFCGTQYHRECWGGPSPPNTKATEVDCNFDCSGDLNQWCGGNGEGAASGNAHMSLFATNTTLPPPPGTPSTNPGVNGYTSIGCWTETTTGGRSLPVANTGDVRTVAACVSSCSAKGYKYAGLQYGGECYCGNAQGQGSVLAAAQDCSMPCRDNATEYCGGPSRNNVYLRNGEALPTTSSALSTATSAAPPVATGAPGIKQTVGAYTYQGCYTENTGEGRALRDKSYYNDLMTLELCAQQCDAYTYFGTQYGRECYCGAQLQGKSAKDDSPSSCQMLCPGDKTSFCGSSSRLSLFMRNASGPNSTTTTAPVSTSSVASSVGTSTTASSLSTSTTASSLSTSAATTPVPPAATDKPAPKQSVGSFKYQGCFTENNGPRALQGKNYFNDLMTLELCAQACGGFKLFGVQYGRECYCDNELRGASAIDKSAQSCSLLCPGDGSTFCGASMRISLYKLDEPAVSSSVALSTSLASTTRAQSSTVMSSPASSVVSSSSTVVSSSTTVASSSSTVVSSSSTVASSSSTVVSSSTTAASSSTTVAASSSTSLSLTTASSSMTSQSTGATTSRVSSSSSASSTPPASSTSTTSSASSTSPASSTSMTSSTSSTASTQSATTSSSSQAATTSSASSTSTSTPSSTSSTASPQGTVVAPLWPGNVNFTYMGCVKEPSAGRLLSRQVLNDAAMTHAKCFEACSSGYDFVGLQYGRECWCSPQSLNWQGNKGATPASNATDSACNVPCAGNKTEMCGGHSLITLFYRDSAKQKS